MKYTLILRKLLYNDKVYYQVIDKAIGEETFDDEVLIVDSKSYLNKTISSFKNSDNKIVYLAIEKNIFDQLTLEEPVYFKKENNELKVISDIVEYNDINFAFHNQYHDFRLIPDYEIESLITNVKEDLSNKLLGQKNSVLKILQKIYDNHMYFESDLPYDEIYKNKRNIFLMGPFGTGKSTIVDSLVNNLSPIPVICVKLTGNFEDDILEITRQLWILSGGNKFLAERGIVIFDGINSMSSFSDEGEVVSYASELEKIIKGRDFFFQRQDEGVFNFDYSLITNILIVDMNYDSSKKIVYDDLYYSRVYGEKLLELGFCDSMVLDLFDNEVIFMEDMTYELAVKILKSKKFSPLYKMKQMLEGRGKKVHITSDFIDLLADYGLDFELGFTGIIKTLKYVLESKDMTLKNIVFKGEDLLNLSVGTINPLYDSDEVEAEEEDTLEKTITKKDEKIDDELDVDIIKRTINGLTIMDTANIIKEKVKGHDDQIFSIVNAFYNHIFNRHKGFSTDELREMKKNVLLIAGTGVGKTAILLNLVKIFNIPYVRESAPRFTKAGYHGADVDDMLLDLIKAAKGNVKKAEYGILFIDEIDKIRASHQTSGVDLDAGVQNELLTLIEGEKRIFRDKQTEREIEFDTSNLFVIGCGAFAGLDKITEARIKKENGFTTVGFKNTDVDLSKISLDPTNQDLHTYGYDTQFTGRFANKIRLHNLNEEILYEIINNQNGGFVCLNVKSYSKSGIKISMSEAFKRQLAHEAYQKGEGARGIATVFSNIINEIDRNVLNGDVKEVILNENSLVNPKTITYIKK